MLSGFLGPTKSSRSLAFSGQHSCSSEESINEIRLQIANIEDETSRTRCKIQKARERITTRNDKIAEIIKNLSITKNSSIACLQKAVMLLEAKKRNATQELALIQESDDFNHSKENESDVIRLYEENQRLDKELIKAKEIEGILINDISYAYEFQLNAKKMEKELEKMKSDIEKMKSQVSYQSKTSGKLVPKNYLDKENLLNEIKLIEATLTAERVSASKTEETEKNGNLILTKATEDAVNKLCSYIKEVKANV